MFMFLFLFFSMLLLCSFFRLKELFQAKNGVTTSLPCFFENAKNLSRSDDGKRRKKRGWPKRKMEFSGPVCVVSHREPIVTCSQVFFPRLAPV